MIGYCHQQYTIAKTPLIIIIIIIIIIANRLQHNPIQNASLSTWALCPEKAEAISGVR
jgi:hypothetical protein